MDDNWESYFKDRCLNEQVIEEYLTYIAKLKLNNIPIIFEVEHLSYLLGLKYLELNKMIYSSPHFYREFKIPKKKGGFRTISSPFPSLASCQNWIYDNILKKINTHFCAHAYKPSHSIITNASAHLGADCVLKMDITNFFSSVPISWVVNFFSNLGYSNNVAYALSSLCCLNGVLPQGASTSPALSNILFCKLDNRLYFFSKYFNLSYTRYADDLVFSGSEISPKLIVYISKIVENYGFSINIKKTKLLSKVKQKIVTGVDISGNTLTLPRKSRRDIKKQMFFINKYGLMAHMNKEKIRNPNYLNSLEGKIRFWLQIEPNNQEAVKLLKSIVLIK